MMLSCMVIPVTVDYSVPFAQAVEGGAYRHVNEDINERHFVGNRALGRISEEILLVQCLPEVFHWGLNEGRAETEYIYRGLYECDLRPANLNELLAVGMQHEKVRYRPDCDLNVFALGSEWRDQKGRPLVPSISGWVNNEGYWWDRNLCLTFSRGSEVLGDARYSTWGIADNDLFACVHV